MASDGSTPGRPFPLGATPVPGGVGPMTIAMLLRSTLKAAKLADS